MQKKSKNKNKNHKKPNNLGNKQKIYWIYGLIALILIGSSLMQNSNYEEMLPEEILSKIDSDNVKSIIVYTNVNEGEIILNNGKKYSFNNTSSLEKEIYERSIIK